MSLGPLMIGLRGTSIDADERRWLESPLIGGVILFTRNYGDLEQLETLAADIHAVRDPPLLVTVDQEGGRVQRFCEPFARLPALRAFGHLWDRDPDRAARCARSVTWLMAAELRAVGVDMSFTPVVDLDLGLADVIGDRALHGEAEVVSRLALAMEAGAHAAGMAITAKHFPTHAGSKSDSHTRVAVDRRDFDELGDDLAPYRQLIRRGLHSVMVGHVIFPALDPLPASFSRWWIKTQLREELGFSGAVISDDIGMVGASVVGDLNERAVKALEAGCDLVLVCNVSDAIPGLLERLRGYVNPAAQLRLIRLRGGKSRSWQEVRASAEWRRARDDITELLAPPRLELEG
jgi:beta-N-acetylhexosaminidase